MKKILFLALLFLTIQGWAQKEVIDKVTATVGGELVLLSEVEEQHALLEAQNGGLPDDARCQIFEGLMVSKLMLNQSKLDSIEVSEEEVEVQLQARIDRILGFMNGDMSQFEAYYGQSINDVKEQFREDLKNQILTDRMRGQVLAGVKVTPSEVKNFFGQIPYDSLPYFNSEVEIGEIVYKPKVNSVEKEKAIAKLEEIRTRILEGGEKFEELAGTFSDDGSARIGGDLGWAQRGKFVPEFEAAAYKLEQGEISPVTESEFGLHIIQLLERRGNSIHVRHILVRPEVTDADFELAHNHMDSVRQLILDDSLTFSQAVRYFSDEKIQSYTNDGRLVNPATGNTFYETGDLEPDIYFTIDTMDINGISAPFEFTDPSGGDTYIRLVQLQSRSAPHRANLQLDYSKIRQASIESKQNEFINGWVENRIESTYIAIDAIYDGCTNLDIWRKKNSVRP